MIYQRLVNISGITFIGGRIITINQKGLIDNIFVILVLHFQPTVYGRKIHTTLQLVVIKNKVFIAIALDELLGQVHRHPFELDN